MIRQRHGRGLDYLTLFADRQDAGARLAERLIAYRGQNAIVLGIPRGGVPVAAEVARRLEADLDVIVARKVGAPESSELAIGAVTANGGRFFNDAIIRELGVTATYLERAVVREMAEAHRREALFRGNRPMHSLRGRIVIVVDDGLATGATMQAAVRSVQKREPARLVAAVPVGSTEACEALKSEVDELVCLYAPEAFLAVGLFYESFEPVADAEVQAILREAGPKPGDQHDATGRQMP